MLHSRSLMIALDLQHDDATLAWADLVTRAAKIEHLHLLHVVDDADLPEEVRELYPDAASEQEDVEQALRMAIGDWEQRNPDTKVHYHVRYGAASREILAFLGKHEIDAVLCGRGHDPHTLGKLATRLVAKAPCSVIVVPQGCEPGIGSILIPVDFSENARLAVEAAARLAEAASITELTILHAYQVPTGYHRSGKSYEEFAEIMKGNAEKAAKEFLDSCELKDRKIQVEYRLAKDPSETILGAITELDPDLVCVGARGRGAIAGMLLGSVAERLIHRVDRPIAAIKEKGKNMSLLQILMKEAGLA